jgi:hypothetical protein
MSLAISLYHGRNTKQEQLDGWGFDGPVIGGIEKFHVTYHSHLRLFFKDVEYALRVAAEQGWAYEGAYDGVAEVWVWFVEDLFPAGGKYYGDWTVFPEPQPTSPGAFRDQIIEALYTREST